MPFSPVYHQVMTVMVGRDATSGELTAALMANGRPAVAYVVHDGGNEYSAHIVRSTDDNAESWGSPESLFPLVPFFTICRSLSLTRSGSDFYLYAGVEGALRRLHFSEGGSGAEDESLVLDDPLLGTAGFLPSTANDQNASWAVYDRRASSESPTGIWFANKQAAFINLEISTGSCNFPAAIQLSQYPAAACTAHSDGEGQLMYMRATDSDGAAWTAPQILVTGRDIITSEHGGTFLTGAERPLIGFWSESEDALYTISAADSLGDTWLEPVLVEAGCQTDRSCTVLEVNGMPCIAYVDDKQLKYRVAADKLAQSWNDAVVMAETTAKFGEVELLAIGDRPLIIYVDHLDHSVRMVNFE